MDRAEARTGVDRVTWRPVMARQHSVRYLERVPLGTPYTEIVTRVREVVDRLGVSRAVGRAAGAWTCGARWWRTRRAWGRR